MSITREMKLERALEHLKAELKREQDELDRLEHIRMTEVIIMRNKKAMYIAEIKQMIRKAEDELAGLKEGKAS